MNFPASVPIQFAGAEPAGLSRIERALAYFGARTTIETYAQRAASTASQQLWDVSDVDAGEVEDVAAARRELGEAVLYLESRCLVRRPVPGYPQFIAFTEAP